MKDVIIPVKTDLHTKKRAQAVARNLGFGLSTLLNAYLKQLIKDKVVYFGLAKTFPEKPTPILTLNEIKKKILPILKSHKIKRAAIFGSYARGDARSDSDVDILAEFPKGFSLLNMGGLNIDIEESLGKKVDLIEYRAIRPELKDRILSEKIEIL